jgi:glycosyltransferase involved in cell wall biosynthesis
MRIGIIAPPWLPVPPHRYGGTENMIDGLCRGLKAQGHDVHLVAPVGSRCPVPTTYLSQCYSEQMGHAVIEAPYALRAYSALENWGAEVIHDHTQIGFLLAPLYHAYAVPIVTTNHNQFDLERRRLYLEAAARGVAVVAISADHASTAGGARVAAVIHHGVDVDRIPVGKGDGGYACVLGRMAPAKGIREAILIAKDAGMPLRIAAKMQEPREHQYFRDVIYPLLGGDIEYEGEVSARGKYELLGGAVALLNPLQWAEPFGMSMIEALATGTPVLSTLMGSAPEIVDHGTTGWLRNQWSQLSTYLERIGEIDRAACRQAAEERFSIDRMAADYVTLYRSALSQERAA